MERRLERRHRLRIAQLAEAFRGGTPDPDGRIVHGGHEERQRHRIADMAQGAGGRLADLVVRVVGENQNQRACRLPIADEAEGLGGAPPNVGRRIAQRRHKLQDHPRPQVGHFPGDGVPAARRRRREAEEVAQRIGEPGAAGLRVAELDEEGRGAVLRPVDQKVPAHEDPDHQKNSAGDDAAAHARAAVGGGGLDGGPACLGL